MKEYTCTYAYTHLQAVLVLLVSQFSIFPVLLLQCRPNPVALYRHQQSWPGTHPHLRGGTSKLLAKQPPTVIQSVNIWTIVTMESRQVPLGVITD